MNFHSYVNVYQRVCLMAMHGIWCQISISQDNEQSPVLSLDPGLQFWTSYACIDNPWQPLSIRFFPLKIHKIPRASLSLLPHAQRSEICRSQPLVMSNNFHPTTRWRQIGRTVSMGPAIWSGEISQLAGSIKTHPGIKTSVFIYLSVHLYRQHPSIYLYYQSHFK